MIISLVIIAALLQCHHCKRRQWPDYGCDDYKNKADDIIIKLERTFDHLDKIGPSIRKVLDNRFSKRAQVYEQFNRMLQIDRRIFRLLISHNMDYKGDLAADTGSFSTLVKTLEEIEFFYKEYKDEPFLVKYAKIVHVLDLCNVAKFELSGDCLIPYTTYYHHKDFFFKRTKLKPEQYLKTKKPFEDDAFLHPSIFL